MKKNHCCKLFQESSIEPCPFLPLFLYPSDSNQKGIEHPVQEFPFQEPRFQLVFSSRFPLDQGHCTFSSIKKMKIIQFCSIEKGTEGSPLRKGNFGLLLKNKNEIKNGKEPLVSGFWYHILHSEMSQSATVFSEENEVGSWDN